MTFVSINSERERFGLRIKNSEDGSDIAQFLTESPVYLPEVGETIELQSSPSAVDEQIEPAEHGFTIINTYQVESRAFRYTALSKEDVEGEETADEAGIVATLSVSEVE